MNLDEVVHIVRYTTATKVMGLSACLPEVCETSHDDNRKVVQRTMDVLRESEALDAFCNRYINQMHENKVDDAVGIQLVFAASQVETLQRDLTVEMIEEQSIVMPIELLCSLTRCISYMDIEMDTGIVFCVQVYFDRRDTMIQRIINVHRYVDPIVPHYENTGLMRRLCQKNGMSMDEVRQRLEALDDATHSMSTRPYNINDGVDRNCLLYTSPSPRDS